ncbi:hypothetical protein AXF42_Ash008830 [Apostasia shenzhenica]|uniref:RNase H type-1 domain-containing protein n=1 Tax=Apostasia shenzhenica TaxID=1088818 RepID=A0A2I0ASL6_9ASPA|nr:hypothetical protein AXF42_Ash008830 [Apostasia shenzhenica]
MNFALSMTVKCIQVFSDSQLVVNQVNRAFETKDEILKKYLQQAQFLISQFEDFSLTHILREENQVADRLAKVGLPDLRRTQVFERPNFKCAEVYSKGLFGWRINLSKERKNNLFYKVDGKEIYFNIRRCVGCEIKLILRLKFVLDVK